MVIERRRERRLKVILPIVINYPGNPPIHAQTENISRLGTYLEMEQEIPLGTIIDITIEIPAYTDEKSLIGSLNCQGHVFRCKLNREIESRKFYGVGIFFSDFSPENIDKLSKYIDFSILEEEENIKQAAHRWREKRMRRQAQKRS